MPRTAALVSATCTRLLFLLLGLSLLTSVVQSWPNPRTIPQPQSSATPPPPTVVHTPAPAPLEVSHYGHQLVSAQRAWVDGAGGAAWRHLAGCRPDLRGWEHAYLQAQFFPPHFALVDLPADIQAVAFSPDGRYLAAGFAAAPAKVWDLRTGQELHPATPYPVGVKKLIFSREGTRIASAAPIEAPGLPVQVWEAATGKVLLQLRGDVNHGTHIALSPDGTRLAINDKQETSHHIWVYSVDSQRQIGWIDLPEQPVTSLDFSSGGKQLLCGLWVLDVRIYDILSAQVLCTLVDSRTATSSIFSPDNRQVALIAGSTIAVYTVATGQHLATLTGHAGLITSAHFTADGTQLVSTSTDTTVRIWDIRGGPALARLAVVDSDIARVASSANSAWLAMTGKWGNHGSQIRLWDHRRLYHDPNAIDVHGHDDLAVVNRETVIPGGFGALGALGALGVAGALGGVQPELPMWYNMVRLTQPFRSLANRPGDGMIGNSGFNFGFGAGPDPQHRLLFTSSSSETAVPALGTVSYLTLPRDRQTWYIVQGDGNVYGRSWVTAQRQLTHDLFLKERSFGNLVEEYPTCMACSPDGAWLAVGTKSGSVRTINVRTNERGPDLFAPDEERGSIMGVLFHPDGQHVYFAHADHSIWRSELQPDATSEIIVAAPTTPGTTPHTGMALDPSGRWLAYHDGRTVTLRDAHTGNVVRTFAGRAGPSNGLCFSPDGQLLVGAADACTAQAWDVASGQSVWQTTGQRGQMFALAFSPDGQRVVLSDSQRRISGWERRTGQMLFRILTVNNLVHSLAFSPDGRRLVASVVGPQIGVERLAPWTAAVELPPFEANMFVQQWDARTDQLDRTFVWFADTPTYAALNHAGTRALTHHADASTKLWDTRTGQRCTDAYLPSEFRGPISGDGRWRIVCAGDDLQLHAVDPDPAATLRRVSAVDIDWHRQRAAQVDQAEQFAAAAFHLGILIQAEPSNPYHRLRRGLARVAAGDLGAGHDVGWGVLQLLVTPKWLADDWPLVPTTAIPPAA